MESSNKMRRSEQNNMAKNRANKNDSDDDFIADIPELREENRDWSVGSETYPQLDELNKDLNKFLSK
eukprot:CAMPEP_0194301238 /NCGR_PEP_ID=MMETSP0169-20130528/61688_1 /TAXON_ID=218684 /ORGANISM="Corethron pennatum, Strain L29A3" /LENGTH=66 /DNA_ID=CAMNT_0039051469 /DNA_START=507 /DNA_END=707 /DNA_ORIENTATION=-